MASAVQTTSTTRIPWSASPVRPASGAVSNRTAVPAPSTSPSCSTDNPRADKGREKGRSVPKGRVYRGIQQHKSGQHGRLKVVTLQPADHDHRRTPRRSQGQQSGDQRSNTHRLYPRLSGSRNGRSFCHLADRASDFRPLARLIIQFLPHAEEDRSPGLLRNIVVHQGFDQRDDHWPRVGIDLDGIHEHITEHRSRVIVDVGGHGPS
jgi:hypothetical protein